ncbi:hypothetical protein HMPREF1863_00437 [Aedoeadaptatus coxii]|uniref:Uncharacterized protein n=2 Tax=Aedoeadaptatus coxii TaxID=755172 RepID=A0A134AJ27_9FIRM|nr:hypothetical protein HMPREF1863_00437 [Peptoniphilus coxii]
MIMNDYRKRGVLLLSACFLLGFTVVLLSSDRTPRPLKEANYSFNTRFSGRAQEEFSIKKAPSFLGDGVSLYIYTLKDDDMKILKTDLKTKKSYPYNSPIGEAVAGDLQLALREPDATFDFGSLNKYDYYVHDRSPFKTNTPSNYDALMVEKNGNRVVYIVSDS